MCKCTEMKHGAKESEPDTPAMVSQSWSQHWVEADRALS